MRRRCGGGVRWYESHCRHRLCDVFPVLRDIILLPDYRESRHSGGVGRFRRLVLASREFDIETMEVKTLRLSEKEYAAMRIKSGKVPAPRPWPAPPAEKADQPDRWPLVLRDQIVEAGLPEPFREFVWHPTRSFRLDLAWPNHPRGPFGCEVDGAVHRLKDKFKRDIERHYLLVKQGWIYIRVTPEMVRSGEALQWVKEFIE